MKKSIAYVTITGAVWAGLSAFSGGARAEGPTPAAVSGLETPTSTKTVKLPNDGSITCVYWPDVSVRMLVENSEAAQETIFVATPNVPCKKGKLTGTAAKEVSNALVGRKGSLYVFADSTGVQVFDLAARKKIHQGEVARAADGLSPSDPKGMVVGADAAGLRIGYRHEVYETCSILADKACWGKLAKLAGLPADLAGKAPNCAAAYKAAGAQPDFTSAISFRRDVTIALDGKVGIAVSGPVECRSL